MSRNGILGQQHVNQRDEEGPRRWRINDINFAKLIPNTPPASLRNEKEERRRQAKANLWNLNFFSLYFSHRISYFNGHDDCRRVW